LGHNKEIRGLAVTSTGLVSVSVGGDNARIWNLAAMALIGQFNLHEASVASVAISPDGRIAATGGNDEHVRIWQLP